MPTVKQNENEYPHNSMNPIEKQKENAAAAVAGMFLVDLIPLLGFPIAFLWAQAKLRSKKLKLAAITAAFILLNIIVMVFFYAASITLMHDSLAKAVQEQGIIDAAYTDQEQSLSPDLPSSFQPDTSIGSPIIMDNSDGVISAAEAGVGGNIPQDKPSDIKLPETDKDGNTYVDTDNDGEFDSYIDSSGNLIQMDSVVDDKGNRYMDYDGNGIYETLIDRNGAMYYDLDGDGKYETKLSDE